METVVPELDLYSGLYLVTLLLHLALVSFPLGGSVLLCLFEIFRGEEITNLRELISEYLAISIGLAVTAGVAPLLFLELVHPTAFFHAGAILGPWRPLFIVPIAIAFYLAYVQKTESFRRWPGIARLPVRLGTLAGLCSAGVILIVSRRVGADPDQWESRYLDLPMQELIWDALPLLGIVLAAAAVGCSIGSLWLIGRGVRQGRWSPGERFAAEETLLRLSIPVAIGLAVVCEVLRARRDLDVDVDWWILRIALFVTIAGFGIRLHRVGPGRLLATLGAIVGLAVALLLREEQRWESLGEELHRGTRAEAATRGGISAFIASFVVAATGIALTLRTISRRPPPEPDDDEPVEEIG